MKKLSLLISLGSSLYASTPQNPIEWEDIDFQEISSESQDIFPGLSCDPNSLLELNPGSSGGLRV